MVNQFQILVGGKIVIAYSVFMLLVFLTISRQSIAQVPAEEREVLLTLFNITDGQNWNNNSGWDPNISSEGTECSWYGVECFEGNIVSLVLRANNLTGPIPKALGNLENLEFLNLRFNQLNGGIPAELGGFSKLKELNLSRNNLTGSIPIELGFLNIERLILNENQLTGAIPPELGNLPDIEFIALDYNFLTGSIPAELGNLRASLTDLRLDHNNLTGIIPPQLGNIEKLWRLELQQNQLTGPVPGELGVLEYLEHLTLQDNQLQGYIPSTLLNKRGLVFNYAGNPELVSGAAANSIFLDDREWRQVTDTIGYSWNDMATACDEETGECSGIVGQVDLTGWIWASVDDVNSLFRKYLDSAEFGPGPDKIELVNSHWAHAFLSGFFSTMHHDFFNTLSVNGLTRTSSETDTTQASEGAVLYVRPTKTGGSDSMRTDQEIGKDTADQFLGHWFYRNTSELPPGKITLNSDASATKAIVSGGVTTDGGSSYVTDVYVGETIQILIKLRPEVFDIRADSEVFVVAAIGTDSLLVTPSGLVTWDGRVETLLNFDEIVLAEENEMNILDPFGGEITLTAAEIGSYRFYVGYTIAGGAITYNDEAITLNVSEAPVQ